MGRFRITIVALSFIFLGCDRPISSEVSKITIEVPKKLDSLGSLSTLPVGRKACFGINVTGSGIKSNSANSCSPSTGVLAGFVEPGQVIEASVPKGPARKIELFVFLQPLGQNLPCPTLKASFTASQLMNTFLVASTDGIDLNAPEVAVTMTMSFPGLTQHLAQELALPATCLMAQKPQPTGVGFNSGGVHGSSLTRNYRVSYRIGETIIKPKKTSSPHGYKLRQRK